MSSSQAKGTKSTSFLMNEVDLIPLACENEFMCVVWSYTGSIVIIVTIAMKPGGLS